MSDKTIASEFQQADQARSGVLEKVRECAALTCPAVLPPEGSSAGDQLSSPYQSLGLRAFESIVGKTAMSLFPNGLPWFREVPSAEARVAPDITPEGLAGWSALLLANELLMTSKMDATNYRLVMRRTIEDVLVAGESCSHLMEDYQLRRFRPDQFVTRRSQGGQRLATLVKESKDVTTLTEDQIAKSGIDVSKYENKTGKDRCVDLYTKESWQRAGDWVIRQEINGKVVNESLDPVSPFIVTTYRHYGAEEHPRGFVEGRLGDLKSFNSVSTDILDGIGVIVKMLLFADATQGADPKELLRPNGSVIMGKVTNGIPDGYGMLVSNKHLDLQVAADWANGLKNDLGQSMLLETASQPTGDRVTAAQVMRIARELDGAFGGVYVNIADEMQRPFLKRFKWQMKRDRLLIPVSAEYDKYAYSQVLTGAEALSRQMELDRFLQAIQIVHQLPGGAERLRYESIIPYIFEGFAVDGGRFVNTPEEMKAALDQAAQRQMQSDAGKQTIQTIGALVEQGAAQ